MNPTYLEAKAGLKGTIFVYLEGKRVGTIYKRPQGVVYVPKGQKLSQSRFNEHFPSVGLCKRSLELPLALKGAK